MNDSLSFNKRRFATTLASVTIRIRPYQPQHRDQRRHILRSIVPMQREPPEVALAVQDPNDVAERRLGLVWSHERDQDDLDSLDRMVPCVRGIGVTSVCSNPRLAELDTGGIGR